MNKQKTIIFSLLSFFLIAISFVVYSAPWTEPTTMPSSYNPPINTSSTAQTKLGEIGATVFRDANDPNYYVNPSGNSVFSGKITTNYNVQESDSSNTVANKEYVDLKMGSVVTEDAIAAKLYYVKGASNPSCPTGTNEVGRHWVAKTCSLSAGWTVYFSGGWYGVNDTPTESTDYRSCSPDYYDAVMCAGPDPANMLFELTHTLNDCTAIGGTVVTVEDSVKICKVPHTSLSGNCRNNNCYPCQLGSCQDTCSCPTGWKSYKSWMTTAGRCIGSYCYFNIPGHAWANEGRAMVWDGECDGWYADVDYKACY